MSSPRCGEVTVHHDHPMKLMIISDEDRVVRIAFSQSRSNEDQTFQSVHVLSGRSLIISTYSFFYERACDGDRVDSGLLDRHTSCDMIDIQRVQRIHITCKRKLQREHSPTWKN